MGGPIAASLAGFLAGLIGGLGLGGGGVLVMFLTVFAGVPQLTSQGINLLFFIPVGLAALLLHIRNRLVDLRLALPAILLGLAGSLGGSLLARRMGADAVRRLFGALLAGLGLWEAFAPHRRKPEPAGPPSGKPKA